MNKDYYNRNKITVSEITGEHNVLMVTLELREIRNQINVYRICYKNPNESDELLIEHYLYNNILRKRTEDIYKMSTSESMNNSFIELIVDSFNTQNFILYHQFVTRDEKGFTLSERRDRKFMIPFHNINSINIDYTIPPILEKEN